MAKPGVREAVALSAFVLALGAGLWHLPEAARDAVRDVRALRSQSALERQLNGARQVDVDTRVFVEARRQIPTDATFAVVTGQQVDLSNDVTLHAVAPFAGYWLLPRRRVLDAGAADWILSYGGDLGELGLDFARVAEIDRGIALAEVRR